ncbi:MAG: hypothetical protein FRX48_02572 [Lasallia pustulata]|uniref:Uncharacterized protein n=1 Tax=Lasallia pustulata TaxID=136370 RepID=A0A5M8PYT3_9LECA|nr:MAG: hypothetical protein FRX48_02572 [Lasallia pustulata]
MSQFLFLLSCSDISSKTSLPNSHSEQSIPSLPDLEAGDFHKILTSPLAQSILRPEVEDLSRWSWQDLQQHWYDALSRHDEPTQISNAKPEASRTHLVVLGLAALHAFLQSNVTGPPLLWRSNEIILPESLRQDAAKAQELRRVAVASLTVDGEAAYQLTPDVELFCLARCVLNHPAVIAEDDGTRWARLRVNFWHQRMLSENAGTMQEIIYRDLDFLDGRVLGEDSRYGKEAKVHFLLERAAVHTFHGFDVMARDDLDRAAKETGFEFALTGRLGKRTKFQEKELSQLVVLARSAGSDVIASQGELKDGKGKQQPNKPPSTTSKPQNLDLNDDTLLESISFTKTSSTPPGVADEENLPAALASLDPANQPVLRPLDSIILLSLASSITNTSPQHGLTREATLPYATRVLEGGSTNWQVYTQALLVRSRIEGYRSRTTERGVLQLQALVDQVIAETSSTHPSTESSDAANSTNTTTTFLPRPKPSESASVSERLQYIHPLASPTRWTLEAELAARWVSLGCLRTALEIYERLQMWAEAALCWAAVEREDKARRIIRSQLYEPTPSTLHPSNPAPAITILNENNDDLTTPSEDYLGPELNPLPPSAPRLFCILGDLDHSPTHYERAWSVSGNRYARAQRSLGKYYLACKDYAKADTAYSQSLQTNPQNNSTWFALGCARLELRKWRGAADAFARCVQIEDSDAEAWSNLAAALLRLPPEEPHRHAREALVALKRAAALKRSDHRIWLNLLAVAAALSPPHYADLVVAQTRIIELRGAVQGEGCVDVEVLEGLVARLLAGGGNGHGSDGAGKERKMPLVGVPNMVVELVLSRVRPLVTASRRLWVVVAKVGLFLGRPGAALEAYEGAWRGVLRRGGGKGAGGVGGGGGCDGGVGGSYESLGGRRRERERGGGLYGGGAWGWGRDAGERGGWERDAGGGGGCTGE